MAKYLNPSLVCSSFKRLVSRNKTGKTHMERTSALMYFLAFDAACKQLQKDCLDLSPTSLDGRNNRKQVELEFSKLVLVESSLDSLKQVTELGKVDIGGNAPEKRISSNFFTVPLKKASNSNDAFYYPTRPTPLLKMGRAATGKQWGIEFHGAWATNLPVFISEIKEPTPFLDLAIFICRDCRFDDECTDLTEAIVDQLEKRFTKKLSDFWASKIQRERLLAKHIQNPFSDRHSLFANAYCQEVVQTGSYEKMKKDELIERIHFLEDLLTANEIDY